MEGGLQGSRDQIQCGATLSKILHLFRDVPLLVSLSSETYGS